MAVNQHFADDYDHSAAANNTPAGSDSIGTDLDDHLRDIKRNINLAARRTTVAAKTTGYTSTVSDHGALIPVDATAGTVTVTLPAAGTVEAGWWVAFKKVSTNTNSMQLDGNSTETIDGTQTVSTIIAQDVFTVVSDGTNWLRLTEGVDFNRIDSASISATLNVAGDVHIAGDLSVSGTAIVGPLHVDGTTSLSGAVAMHDTLSVAGTAVITGAVTMDADLSVSASIVATAGVFDSAGFEYQGWRALQAVVSIGATVAAVDLEWDTTPIDIQVRGYNIIPDVDTTNLQSRIKQAGSYVTTDSYEHAIQIWGSGAGGLAQIGSSTTQATMIYNLGAAANERANFVATLFDVQRAVYPKMHTIAVADYATTVLVLQHSVQQLKVAAAAQGLRIYPGSGDFLDDTGWIELWGRF